MMKRVRVILCASFVLFVYGSAFVDGAVLSGEGSSANPYLIDNLADFNVFANPANAATYWASGVHVKLTNNISLAGLSYETAVIAPSTVFNNFNFYGTPYKGSFNGSGFEISGMTINDNGAGNSFIGLFGSIEGGVVENLGVVNCSIDVGFQSDSANQTISNLGLLGGRLFGGSVINCYSTGTLKATAHGSQQANAIKIGGMFGSFEGTMSDSYSSCTLTVSGVCGYYMQLNYIGGLCGLSEYGSISDSYATGAVTVTASKGLDSSPYIGHKIYSIGGLCGQNEVIIKKCYSSGPVQCSSNSFSDSTLQNIGGLIGNNLYGPVSDSYTTSSVSAIALADRRFAHCREIGGLIGYNKQTLTNCYSAAAFSTEVSSGNPLAEYEGNQGGLCGYNSGTVTACFWDKDVSGMTDGVGNVNPDPAGVTGKSTGEMGVESLYTSAGWDFDLSDGSADWKMSGGYPKLTWEAAYTVGLEEFAMLAEYWQMTGCDAGLACDAADWYDDGTINVLDLLQLAKSWMGAEIILE
ncbi:MAG: hypothetical protein K9M75_03890 [Phycisphaerae bacterium]|nr:hypothetical protein [Phycisphaerae bacterium]